MDNSSMFFRPSLFLKCIYAAFVVLLLGQFSACSDGLTELERIKKRGSMRVVILAAPPMFFPDESVLRGMDYEMAINYAKSINVKAEIVAVRTLGEMLSKLRQGKAHLAIADSIPPLALNDINTSTPYNPNEWYIIGNRENALPGSIEDITPGNLVVAESSGPALVMKFLKQRHPALNWMELPEGNTRQVLEQVNINRFRLSVINSDVFTYYRQLYPEIRIAFKLTEIFPSSWLTLAEEDKSLEQSINRYIQHYQASGKLEKLQSTYFRHLKLFRYIDNVYYLKRIETLLPKYQDLFAAAARQYDFDERFLAAVSYQESHWNAEARSMTGVRGLMMLTQETAKRVGVSDRLNPRQSIDGGAKYLNILKGSLPTDIKEPDRSWLTLAAYNVGLGHLEDARVLTEQAGDDPNLWVDVEKHLPKLSEKQWYTQTKHGFARGHEPVAFVRRIRRYFDILRLYQQEELLKKLYQPVNYDKLKISSPLL